MTAPELNGSADREDLEDQAADILIQCRKPTWSVDEQRDLDARVARDASFADAYQRVQASWDAVGRHAATPELMAFREQAIARARQLNVRRWSLPGARWRPRSLAAIAAMLLAGVAIWELSPYGHGPQLYKTGFGEQRAVELSDHSHVVLDARTRLRVRFTKDARVVELLEGQAQFSVAKDPSRPFKVEAGAKSIVAVGTVFDVAYFDRQVQVAMFEGKVAVLSRDPQMAGPISRSASPAPETVELLAGQGLQVSPDGHAAVVPKADLEAATAWRQGKVIFRDEPLAEAVHRLNRYTGQQVVIDDPALASMRVSGVFDSGDAQAFAEAMQAYLPVTADFSDGSTIHLRTKSSP